MPDRSKAPEFHPLLVPSLQRPTIEILPNGIEFTRFLNSTQSLVSLEMLFPAGSLDSASRQEEGYVFKMLSEGTRNKTAKQIADSISFLGATVEFSHQADYDIIHLSCLSRFLPAVLRILEEIWREPSFPQKEWEILKDTQIRQNEINEQKTSFLAGRRMRRELFSEDLDYGYSFRKDRVEAYHPEMLRQRFEKLRHTGPALVLVSGYAEEPALAQLRDWLSGFETCRSVIREWKGGLPKQNPGIFWDDRPESQQSAIRMGQFAISSRHEDSALFNLTLEIFGGYFGSRLMSNIREDKGWTYGIYAQRVGLAALPYWTIGTDVNGEVILDAVKEIHKEASVLQQEPVSDEELEKVKNYMLGQFLSSITTVYGLAERYRSVWTHGIDFERVEKNLGKIKAATPEDVLQMARKYLNPDSSVIALAGRKVQ